MPRELSWIPTLVLLAALAAPAAAITVIVPDDHPTIQAAIDAGADVIRVRAGLAPERLTVARPVTLEPGPPPPYSWPPVPMVRSMEVTDESGGSGFGPGFTVRGIRFLGDVKMLTRPQGYLFESCRFDSGFTDVSSYGQAGEYSSVRNCMFIGDARVTGAVQFVGNTVIGGTARIFSDGLHDISHNYITGPAEAGLELYLSDSAGPVSMNTIRGTTDGIRFLRSPCCMSKTLLNDIRDCSGDGIVYLANAFTDSPVIMTCDSNTIERCGGAGIVIRGSDEDDVHRARLAGNVIRQTGLGGIDLPRTLVNSARGNTILNSGGDGFRAWLVDSFETNVIGRSGGTGLRIEQEYHRILGNTIFSNAGPGIHLSGGYSVLMARNICVFNGGPGYLYETTCPPKYCGPPDLSCNDWFANAGGAVVGAPLGATDVSVHPQFCDLANADVRLSQSSPLLAAPGCGLIGALGVGCGPITGVGTMEEGALVGFRAWPVPSRSAVAFSLPASLEPTDIEVFDVTGARRWQAAIPAGVTAAQWDRRENTGRTAPPGVYFARVLRGGAEIARVKVVLTE